MCGSEVVGNHYFWRKVEPFIWPGTPNTPVSLSERLCRHEGIRELGNLYFGEGAASPKLCRLFYYVSAAY